MYIVLLNGKESYGYLYNEIAIINKTGLQKGTYDLGIKIESKDGRSIFTTTQYQVKIKE